MTTAQAKTEPRETGTQSGANRVEEIPAHRATNRGRNEIAPSGRRPTGIREENRNGTPHQEDFGSKSNPGELEQDQMDLAQFIETYKDAIAQTVIQSYTPRYQPGKPGQNQPLPSLVRRPLGAQEHAIRGAALSLEVNPGTIIVGEMGTGKTYIGTAAAHMSGCRNIMVLAPPHLVQKWKREIELTIPKASASIVRTITDLKKIRPPEAKSGPRFTIMSRETAKLSYRWQAAYVNRLLLTENGSRRIDCCPGCFQQIRDKDGIPVSKGEMERKKLQCRECGGALGQPKQEEHPTDCTCRKCGGRNGTNPKYRNRKYALADYIKKRMKGCFDLLICDEVHEYKGRGTAQGIAGGNLAQACGKVLTLTCTLAGGYSSTLFHLLYRFTPELRNEFKHHEQGRWIDRYRFRQKKYRSNGNSEEPFDHGKGSGRRGYQQTEKETPGLAPAALFHIIGNTVFLRLTDVSSELPPYQEQIQVQQMSRNLPPGARYSQKTAYEELYRKMRTALTEALSKGSARLMAAYLQSLLAFPDGCTLGEKVIDPTTTGQSLAYHPWPRTRPTPRNRPSSTWSRRRKGTDGGYWSTPPTPTPGTSPAGSSSS